MRPIPLALSAVLLVFTAAALADDHWPAPVRALADQGLTIHAEFAAPGGLTGYAASAQGRELAIYVTADGEHAVVGTLVDAAGNDLSSAPLDEHVRSAQDAEAWERLERSHWILDGDPEAPRVLYTFTDPNCPYCRQFWEAARPWVEAGEVQLRHIMVGILAQDSPAKAAALLGADDPASALHEHESGTSIAPSAQPREIEEQVYTNNQLFEEFGLIATPTTVARDGQRLVRIQGMPDPAQLIELMGGEAP
ncbi:thiol:disulfide interchange protein DsbG [Halomonas kalidii]|uniref:Thiol:disulfide interchange protein n=1 Tax=Halomonas kalidii TaxID=3043293 RepID=A0ABT6VL59_9GAMM|nr:thiol:disulfide interchange protein DsbG [Halomonas kalidii]MDI5934711.1 thiol:disulfide interchange protein DsbG [Halomonas kalidii]